MVAPINEDGGGDDDIGGGSSSNYNPTVIDTEHHRHAMEPPDHHHDDDDDDHHHHHHHRTVKTQLEAAIQDVQHTLTAAEAFFLHALLIDPPPATDESDGGAEEVSDDEGGGGASASQPHRQHRLERLREQRRRATRVLSDEMLFATGHPALATSPPPQPQPPRAPRPFIRGLWRAHGQGVRPRELIRRSEGGLPSEPRRQPGPSSSDDAPESGRGGIEDYADADDAVPSSDGHGDNKENEEDLQGGASIPSDEELRPTRDGDDSSASTESSWGEEDHLEHWDAWQVLKDEYAPDFGFALDPNRPLPEGATDDDQNIFMILGTTADDAACQPHVLSPPLMDGLMSFLPHSLHNENYWLKFSLVRDGASLQTLKQYSRAANFTVLAVETTTGHVFGSFTSSPWRNHASGFFGGPPAFVWRMRHSRRTKVASLFDQAQLESEIDVFFYTRVDRMEDGDGDGRGSGDRHGDLANGENYTDESFVQVCRHDLLAVGGDQTHGLSKNRADSDRPQNVKNTTVELTENWSQKPLDRTGFALTLDEDLLTGTTSPCATFQSPALCGDGMATETFSVAGLEVWTFTPARDVAAAERLEMTKFFIEQSSRNFGDVDPSSSSLHVSSSPVFSSRDLMQKEFYRRAGDDPESEDRREAWQYLKAGKDRHQGAQSGLSARTHF